MSVELAIRNGVVIDGTGAEGRGCRRRHPRRAHRRRRRRCPRRTTEIDATGKVVTPGFIDIHSHSDFTLLVDPRAASAVHQGVTLEVVGNCGFGCFPLLNKELAPKAIYGHSADVPLTWTSAAGYFERLEEAAPAINVLSLVPNGQIRLSVVGLEDRPGAAGRADEDALPPRRGARAGRLGLLDRARVRGRARRRRGRARLDVRGLRAAGTASTRRTRACATQGADEAVEEALRTAERSGVRLQVSHLVPRNGLESARRCIELVDDAAAGGMDIAFDMHTRLYGTTFLLTALPPWALEDPARLRRGARRARSSGARCATT